MDENAASSAKLVGSHCDKKWFITFQQAWQKKELENVPANILDDIIINLCERYKKPINIIGSHNFGLDYCSSFHLFNNIMSFFSSVMPFKLPSFYEFYLWVYNFGVFQNKCWTIFTDE